MIQTTVKWMRIFLIALMQCALVTVILAIFGFGVFRTGGPHYLEDPEIVAEYSQCVQDGGREQNCHAMAKELHQTRFGATEARNACEAARASALSECVTGLEDRSYDGGQLEYKGRTRSSDTPLCQRIADNAYAACHNFK